MRLANIMKEINLLPDNLLTTPSVRLVQSWYACFFSFPYPYMIVSCPHMSKCWCEKCLFLHAGTCKVSRRSWSSETEMQKMRKSHMSKLKHCRFLPTPWCLSRLHFSHVWIQFHKCGYKHPKPAQRCDSHHGSRSGGVQGDVRHRPGCQPKRSVLPGSFLYEQDIHQDVAQPAQ